MFFLSVQTLCRLCTLQHFSLLSTELDSALQTLLYHWFLCGSAFTTFLLFFWLFLVLCLNCLLCFFFVNPTTRGIREAYVSSKACDVIMNDWLPSWNCGRAKKACTEIEDMQEISIYVTLRKCTCCSKL